MPRPNLTRGTGSPAHIGGPEDPVADRIPTNDAAHLLAGGADELANQPFFFFLGSSSVPGMGMTSSGGALTVPLSKSIAAGAQAKL